MTWYVIDGMDGCGKNTVADALAEELAKRGRKAFIQTHPSDRVAGRISRKILIREGKAYQALATLFFIIDVLGSLMRMRFWKGYDDIIFVRYIMAAAYLPDRIVDRGYDLIARLLPMPEHLLLVDTPPEKAMCRIIERGHELEMFESVEKLDRIRNRMLGQSHKGWTIIDNSNSRDSIRHQLDDYLG